MWTRVRVLLSAILPALLLSNAHTTLGPVSVRRTVLTLWATVRHTRTCKTDRSTRSQRLCSGLVLPRERTCQPDRFTRSQHWHSGPCGDLWANSPTGAVWRQSVLLPLPPSVGVPCWCPSKHGAGSNPRQASLIHCGTLAGGQVVVCEVGVYLGFLRGGVG